MPVSQLNPKILKKLSEKLGIKESSVRQSISRLKQSYPSCTLNAVAQIFAVKNGYNVLQQLSANDKASLPHIELQKEKIKISAKTYKAPEKLKILIDYPTTNHFIKGHLDELNKTYTYKCYTASFILLRKIIENLVIDILQKNYPPELSQNNKELYWDIKSKRFKDFSVILKNLFDKRQEFSPSKNKAIERLYQLVTNFKDEANNKTHSWFHLVENSKELEGLTPQYLIELIKTIEN